jgi:hypothetical protein
MSDHTISIPHTLYEKARHLAQQTSQPVDEVIRTRLEDALAQPLLALPTDERAELQAMAYLSDDTLWTIAREQMPPVVQDGLSRLMEKNSQGTITADEYQALSALVERGQRLTLRKAQAMKLLLDRGYTVSLDELKPVNE